MRENFSTIFLLNLPDDEIGSLQNKGNEIYQTSQFK